MPKAALRHNPMLASALVLLAPSAVKITVFGSGYVGLVTAACFADVASACSLSAFAVACCNAPSAVA